MSGQETKERSLLSDKERAVKLAKEVLGLQLMETNRKMGIKVNTSTISSRVMRVEWAQYKKKSGIMTVTFKGNKVYQYEPISMEIVNQMVLSESIGKYLDANIIGKFNYRKLGEDWTHVK